MKPSFALDFRDGAIALLHRTSRGWQQVGATPIDAPDLSEALNYLRSTALGLSPRGLATKLVIPNEQVLYTQVHAPGPEVAKRKRQIRAALEGLTPYKVDELVFDWWGNGPEVQVAVVSKDTLAEAEAFAAEHRFNPVSFVAAPDSSGFMGEPYFGPSALSATLLAEGEKVERDQDPIAVMAREYPRHEPEPQIAPEVEVEVEVEAVAPVNAAVAEVVADLPAPVVEVEVAPPAPEPAPLAADDDPLPDFRAAKAPAAGVGAFDPKAMAIDLVDEAPMAVDVSDERREPPVLADMAAAEPVGPPEVVEPAATSDAAQSIIAAFASRRSAGVEDDAPATAKPSAASNTTEFAAAVAAAKAKKAAPAVGPAPTQRPSVARPALARPAAPLPSASRDTVPFPAKSPAAKFMPGKSAKPGVVAPGIAGLRRERNVVPLPKAATVPGDEGQTTAKPAVKGLTGLDGRPLPVRGKPRYLGLVLTALLLIALAVVAAWSSFYLSSNEADPNAAPATDAVAALTPSTDVAAPTDEAVPSAEDEALADGQDPELAADTVSASAAAPQAAELATEPAAAAPVETVAEVAAPLPEPAPKTDVATDAVAAGTPGNEPQDEIFLAAADTPPQTSDPLMLPQVAANSDPPPTLAAPPPPFGTVYTFDADGRIQPTPEGILTPEGVLLIAGPPKVVPPVRPAALTAVAAAPVTEAVAEAVAVVAEPVEIVSDPALAGKKPKLRPAGLVDAAATAEKQGEVLAPDPNSRFASLRPHQRPQALTTAAVVEPEVANEAAAASLATGGVQASTSTLAVAVSKKPAMRPSGMDQAVDAAVAAAVQAPEPEPQTQTAEVAPEAQAEPEVEAAAPRLPTNASVAKQATTKDALNLSRVALLGIFGNSAGRYAMIRQPGGGVKKVKVGDTVDGGKVAAISATAVQYQKGGRMVTLSLPKG